MLRQLKKPQNTLYVISSSYSHALKEIKIQVDLLDGKGFQFQICEKQCTQRVKDLALGNGYEYIW